MASNINPNDINGAYPVAGQDNNSQGFRDNFTNIKTNFQYAAQEITALQNNSIAINGNNNLGSNTIISGGVFRGGTQSVVSIGSNSNPVFNFSAGSYQRVTFPANVASINFANLSATSGTYAVLRIELTTTQPTTLINMSGTRVGLLAGSTSLSYVKGANVSAQSVTITNDGTYVFEFSTSDGGNTVFIQDLTRGANATPV